MPKKQEIQLPRCGTAARRVADLLIEKSKLKKNAWWFPESEPEARAVRYLRSRGWPIEDFNPVDVGGRNTYRLDPERLSRTEIVLK